MTRLLGASARTLAAVYIAFGVAALILFAAPLWLAWTQTIEAGREEILREDAQRLTEVFRHNGPDGLVAFIRERVGLQIAGERILLLTDSSLHPLAGNLREWPAGLPTKSGTDNLIVNLGGKPARAVLVHVQLDGGYNLLVGRGTER
ncbi:MAG TPA: hypothetical protein VG994_06295, partial [Steroidobacteraceae bacterium]|nr:hypothetical protein [Steroidobacteraceae bacterium]